MKEEFNDLLGQIQRVIAANKATLSSLEKATEETENGLKIDLDEIVYSPGEIAIPSFILTGHGVFNTEINNDNISVSRIRLSKGSYYKPHFHSGASEIAIVIDGTMEEKTTRTIVVAGGTILTQQYVLHNYEAITDVEYIVVYVKL